MKQTIILASASPRRIEIFQKGGVTPRVVPSCFQERIPEGLGPEQTVMYLALGKALETEQRLMVKEKEALSKERTFLFGADTIVYLDEILGKPRDREDAFRMLGALMGKEHRVLTGVALLEAGTSNRRVFFEETKVRFGRYGQAEMEAYVNTGEPFDKAGGYAIQGGFGKYVTGYTGDYNNVIGFPWDRAMQELSRMEEQSK